MLKTKNRTEKIIHIGLIWWVVLFSLSPCAVKEAVFDVLNVEYTKPFNKSKALAHTNSCTYHARDSRHYSFARQLKFDKISEAFDLASNHAFVIRLVNMHSSYSKNSSGNSPPKYILYKRLKIDIG